MALNFKPGTNVIYKLRDNPGLPGVYYPYIKDPDGSNCWVLLPRGKGRGAEGYERFLPTVSRFKLFQYDIAWTSKENIFEIL